MTLRDDRSTNADPPDPTPERSSSAVSEQAEREHDPASEETSSIDPQHSAGPAGDDGSSQADTSDTSSDSAESESASGMTAGAEGGFTLEEERAPLLMNEDADHFRERWESLQIGFVDRPREMVEQADELVSELMQRLAVGFNEQRSRLEKEWDARDDVSTEDLRVALTRYRSFFNRLLST